MQARYSLSSGLFAFGANTAVALQQALPWPFRSNQLAAKVRSTCAPLHQSGVYWVRHFCSWPMLSNDATRATTPAFAAVVPGLSVLRDVFVNLYHVFSHDQPAGP